MDKRTQILNTALILFNRNGFDKTPTSMISKSAEVSTGTLFHYFPTKEELINSLYLTCKESMVLRMSRDVEEITNWRGKLQRIYKNFLEWAIACPEEVFFCKQFSNSPYIREITKLEGRGKFSVLLDFLEEGVRTEVLRPGNTEYMATLLTGMMMASAGYLLDQKCETLDETFVEESFQYLWNCIRY